MKDRRPTLNDYIKLAEHYIAIGDTDIYLSEPCEDFLKIATSAEIGGSYRWSVPVSFILRGEHPCGLSFRCYIDFEDRHNGGELAMNTERLAFVLKHVPSSTASQIRACANQFIAKSLEQATEMRQSAARIEKHVAEFAKL